MWARTPPRPHAIRMSILLANSKPNAMTDLVVARIPRRFAGHSRFALTRGIPGEHQMMSGPSGSNVGLAPTCSILRRESLPR
jgi:hypothetical protein